MGTEAWFRKAVLSVAGNRQVSRLIAKHGMKWGAARFVAAETLEETLLAVTRLNSEGLACTLDYLGESVTDKAAATDSASVIVRMLREICEWQLDANVSVKLTQLGLLLDEEFCLEQMEHIVRAAAETDNFIRIDMEDSAVTDATLRIFERLLHKFGSNRVGLVIQSYLYRSAADIRRLGDLGTNVRIVKGAYCEPSNLAYPLKKDVDFQFIKLAQEHLERGRYTAIATHDTAIIEQLQRYIRELSIPTHRYEFQMLYGIAGSLQRKLAQEGCRVRVYTPFGKQWYPYFTRRIAERPANLLFVAKGLWRR